VPDLRRLGFSLALVALVAALLLVGLRPTPSPRTSPPGSATPTSAADPERPATSVVLRSRARRFINAFLSYEVDPRGTRQEAAIRATASRTFAERLLSDRSTAPRQPGRPRAEVTSLSVDPLPGHPDLALVSGEAHRRAGPEPFAFLLADRGGRWLAVAPGE
jgi:hypothetical protein